MSTSFHAHQHDQAFRSKALSNWEVQNEIKVKPASLEAPLSPTKNFLVDERGHRVKAYPITSRYASVGDNSSTCKKKEIPGVVTNKLHGSPILVPIWDCRCQRRGSPCVKFAVRRIRWR
ncbi:hypothetical protein CYMTET_42030 [Cymbomonas tetramitiformis]|uniref:Uncharacterized protein n=1 Tax=Cymbomonas tetramitiformis TaxID=36881 RepID=A0AAE0C4W2_9CHLO|nr:hypothetical protein CYMTET_42030 [Cymbomonas tetramitiformis]